MKTTLDFKLKTGKHQGRKLRTLIREGNSKYIAQYFIPRNKNIKLDKSVLEEVYSNMSIKVNDIILEKLTLISKNNKVARKLLRFFSRKKCYSKFDNISLASKNKVDMISYDVPLGNKNNQIKITRFINKVFESNGYPLPTPRELEEFLTLFKESFFIKIASDGKYRIPKLPNGLKLEEVSGEDIVNYYKMSNYYNDSGTLAASCMRHDSYTHRTQFYKYNKNVKLIVILDENNKVHARALKWKVKVKKRDNTYEDNYYVERIYFNSNFLCSKIKEYCVINGFYHKNYQKCGNVPIKNSPLFLHHIADFGDITDIKKGQIIRERAYQDSPWILFYTSIRSVYDITNYILYSNNKRDKVYEIENNLKYF